LIRRFAVFLSRHMPCEDCGASVERASAESHVCDPERLLDFQMFKMRDRIVRFDEVFREYLDGNLGRFEVWLAARDVRRTT
jgi:hypothetical protein